MAVAGDMPAAAAAEYMSISCGYPEGGGGADADAVVDAAEDEEVVEGGDAPEVGRGW